MVRWIQGGHDARKEFQKRLFDSLRNPPRLAWFRSRLMVRLVAEPRITKHCSSKRVACDEPANIAIWKQQRAQGVVLTKESEFWCRVEWVDPAAWAVGSHQGMAQTVELGRFK